MSSPLTSVCAGTEARVAWSVERLFHGCDGCQSHKLAPDGLIIIDVHCDINQHPCPACHCGLVPGAGCCPGLIRYMVSVPGNIHGLLPVTIPPLLWIILRCLPWVLGMLFILQLSKTCLVCNFPLINSISYQVISPFLSSLFSSLYEDRLRVSGLFPGSECTNGTPWQIYVLFLGKWDRQRAFLLFFPVVFSSK